MRGVFSFLNFLLLTWLLCSCGKYGPPLPPEAYAPEAVQELTVTAGVEGVEFTWKSPELDRRGKELRDLAYFDIKRSSTDDLVAFLKDPIEESVLVGRSYDFSQDLLNQKRKEAREKKIPVRKVRVEDSLRTHSFRDDRVKPGETYLYSIVPVNTDGVAGEVAQYVRVQYTGLTSKVELLESSAFDKPYTLDF